ncbi:MAG: ribosome biogenesis GTPase Der [bacterium]|nr:ribosome biogenesis GTPase Der [bacterium]
MSTPLSKELSQFPVVVLVGRVNVGKSTLFNRLIEQQKAVTAAVPGTTRDINYGLCDWRGKRFLVVDTGGFAGGNPKGEIEKKVYDQVKNMIKRTHLTLFIVDGKHEVNPEDREFLKIVRTLTKSPVMLVANKTDKSSEIRLLPEKGWLKLGLGEPYPISAASGLGVGDLLDTLHEKLALETERPDQEKETVKIAIIGRTNVGKSSLLNKILGEERVIVSPTPHTTREPQDMVLEYEGRQLVLIDTVGMRKKSKVKSRIDREGLSRSIKSIEKADVVILVLESTMTPSQQESRLVQIAKEVGAGVLLLVNKWDLVEGKDTKSVSAFESYFRNVFSFIQWAPIMFVSAESGKRVSKILDAVMSIQKNRENTINQDELDVFIKKALTKQKPNWLMGKKKPVVHGFSQVGTAPPTFALTVNNRTSLSYPYLRYLENRLRENFSLEGTPIRIHTEERTEERKRKQHRKV